MAFEDFQLCDRPTGERARELWIQHAAGFILFKGLRQGAIDKIDPELSEEAQRAARVSIDDTLYALMMLIDGVSGGLRNEHAEVKLRVVATYVESDDVAQELDLAEGDGMCMGYHGWMEEDFGNAPVAQPRAAKKQPKAGPLPGLMKPRVPSSQLARVIGSKPVTRTEAVTLLWRYFKRHGLDHGSTVTLDANLKALYGKGKKTITVLEVVKPLDKHLKKRK
jgi:hypothetical protein